MPALVQAGALGREDAARLRPELSGATAPQAGEGATQQRGGVQSCRGPRTVAVVSEAPSGSGCSGDLHGGGGRRGDCAQSNRPENGSDSGWSRATLCGQAIGIAEGSAHDFGRAAGPVTRQPRAIVARDGASNRALW